MSPGGSRGLGVLVTAVLVAGTAVIVWNARPRERPGAFPLSPSFEYRLNGREVRSACVPRAGFSLAATWETGLEAVDALAAAGGHTAAAGGQRIVILDGPGRVAAQWDAGEPVRAVALDSNRVWAALGRRVAWWTLAGQQGGSSAPYATNAVIASLSVGGGRLYVADAGTRRVYTCDPDGHPMETLGRHEAASGHDGFLVPSPHFDVVAGPDGLLRVVNPGRHRVELYTAGGDLELVWGKASMAIEGFCGCCNPAHLALLPDGRYVTSEKGLRRVKVYTAQGEFAGVVQGAEEVEPGPDPLALATDERGRILIGAPAGGKVRVYERRD